MKYIKIDLMDKGKALMRKDGKQYKIVILVAPSSEATEKENEQLIDGLSSYYLEYLQKVGERMRTEILP